MENFLYFKELTSTNDYIKENIDSLENKTIVFADIQTKGKGRLGRQWQTPTGNISMSMLFKNQKCDISLYPLICGLSVSEVIDEVCGVNTKIKWPNDIILNNKKLCGILCESIISKNSVDVICGIGVNVNIKREDFDKSSLPYGTSLFIELQKEYDPIDISKKIATNLQEKIKVFNEFGFASLKTLYEQKLVNKGKEVQVINNKETIVCTCLGINEQGNLLCNYNNKIININSGEASVRGLYGYV